MATHAQKHVSMSLLIPTRCLQQGRKRWKEKDGKEEKGEEIRSVPQGLEAFAPHGSSVGMSCCPINKRLADF